MAFNHYAKIKTILSGRSDQWYIVRINRPTTSKKFNGELRNYDHYYRIFGADNKPIPYCKFQQIDRFVSVMNLPIESLPIIDQP